MNFIVPEALLTGNMSGSFRCDSLLSPIAIGPTLEIWIQIGSHHGEIGFSFSMGDEAIS